jgi:anthranilate phosphoribosyltransferase
MIKKVLDKLLLGHDLTRQEVLDTMQRFSLSPDPVEITAFLILLKVKGEKSLEIAALSEFLASQMIRINCTKPLLDIVGTGGDGASTINISTGAAILASSCGITIAKHGSRAVSSKCGSADLIEKLGIPLEQSKESIERSLETINVAFMFAPQFHPVMKTFLPIRQKLGFRTVFNLLGPLLNPAKAEYLIVGVWEESLIDTIASALKLNHVKRALVMHGCALDEISTLGTASGLFLNNDQIDPIEINPSDYGFATAKLVDLQGGSPDVNKELLLEALSGKKGAIGDTLVLNAGIALWLYEKTDSISQGIEIAQDNLQKGRALEKLTDWIHFR